MPYPQDLIGKYVDFRVDPGLNMTPGLAGSLVNGVLPGQTIASVGHNVYLGVATPPMGLIHLAPSGAPWTFAFLKYVAGAVTVAPLAGAIMTGPMSGCFLCKYTEGGQNLAHVGTKNSMDSEESIAVKAAWRTFVARPAVSGVTGASPADFFGLAEHRAASFKFNPTQVVGYFDGGVSYAILLAPIPGNMNSLGHPIMRVASVKTMHLQPWTAIAALRTFRD